MQGDKLVAHTETCPGTYLVDPETLETLGRVQFRDRLHGMVKTAHPFTTREGDVVNLTSDFTPWWDGQYMVRLRAGGVAAGCWVHLRCAGQGYVGR